MEPLERLTDKEFKEIRYKTAVGIYRGLEKDGLSYTQILTIYADLVRIAGRKYKRKIKSYIKS